MKYSFPVFLLANAFVLLVSISCTRQKAEKQEVVKIEHPIVEEEVHSSLDYAYTDSLMQGSHKVVYSITGQPDDELPEVVDEDGMRFKDNRFSLLVEKDGQKLFDRSFTKADFCSMLSKDFVRYGIMDGLRFSHAEDGRLYFNACVSYPESDMSSPFFLVIGPDGSYTIEPDTTLDEEIPPTSDSINY